MDTPSIPEGVVKQVGMPIRLSETPGRVRHAGSVTGQHTAEAMAGL